MKANSDFIDYLSSQERNLLVSLIELDEEFAIFKVMDRVVRDGIDQAVVPKDIDTVAELLLVCHGQFYGAISELLRGKTSDAFIATRKAIDAAFTAYRLQQEPDSVKSYKSRAWSFVTIKRTIADARKKDSSVYPLADGLIDIHEKCSQYAAHADYSAIEPRLEASVEGRRLYHYFDLPKDHKSYRELFLYLLVIYHRVFAIFSGFVASSIRENGNQWEAAFMAVGVKLGEASAQLRNETTG